MTTPFRALSDLKIGVRLAAAFLVCGLLVGIAADALAHRIGLTWRAAAEGKTARGIVGELVQRVRAL